MSDVVKLQSAVFEELDALCSSLDAGDWDVQTDCPGWSVKDNISHIIGTESMLLGREAPEHDPGAKPWIRNPIGANNEIQVDFRRSKSPAEVLDEFREVTSERVKVLGAMSEADLDAESWTPIGQGTVRDLLGIRVMDCWVHEQDIRRAVGKPGGLDGLIAEHAFSRHASAIPFVIGKKVAPPAGTTVVIDVQGLGSVAVGTDGKRAAALDPLPDDPTVRLTMNLETFNCLCCGRGDVAEQAARVKIDGDEALGKKVIGSLNFMI